MINSGMIIKIPSQLVVSPESLAPRTFNKEIRMIKVAATKTVQTLRLIISCVLVIKGVRAILLDRKSVV